MISTTVLNLWNIAHYEPLIAATARPLLPRVSLKGSVFAFGASDGANPTGVVLAVVRGGSLEVGWIYVLASKRRLGVASALMNALEAFAVQRGLCSLCIAYPAAGPAAAPIEGFLQAAGWTTDVGRTVLVNISSPSTSSWFSGCAARKPFEIVPWVELTPSQRDQLRDALNREASISHALSPFAYEEGLDRETSLTLCNASEVVGWLITHPTGATTVHCDVLAVRESFRRSGHGLVILTEAYRRHIRLRGPDCSTTATVSAQNVAMLSLLRGSLGPYTTLIAELSGATKSLA